MDIIEAKVSNAWHVLDTFTDNFSSAVALPVAVDRIQYQWVDGQVPTRLQFRNLNPDNPRHRVRHTKVDGKWQEWRNGRGCMIYA